ncbi:MAG TPA: hypothetical protein VFW48_03135 [Solirubrobacterales bacterium]|nr:hypothetical protein [Solirubrobacterales bacterium]
MAKEVFDQQRPRSAMAQRLDEAFAGCDEWTVAPAPPRRSTLDIAPWLDARGRTAGSTTAAEPESRAA